MKFKKLLTIVLTVAAVVSCISFTGCSKKEKENVEAKPDMKVEAKPEVKVEEKTFDDSYLMMPTELSASQYELIEMIECDISYVVANDGEECLVCDTFGEDINATSIANLNAIGKRFDKVANVIEKDRLMLRTTVGKRYDFVGYIEGTIKFSAKYDDHTETPETVIVVMECKDGKINTQIELANQ